MSQSSDSEGYDPSLDASAQRAPGHGSAGDDEYDEVSLLALANVLLKRWKLIVGLPLAAAFAAAVYSLVVTPKFTAVTTFVPELESEGAGFPGGLAGLAAQFGVGLPSGGATSPGFYADVLASRTLLDQVLMTRFADPEGVERGDSATLLDLLKAQGDTERARLEKGRRKLNKAISVGVDDETYVVTLGVKTRDRFLSADVANQFIELLNRFNLETRQSNAQERRRFVEERLSLAEDELVAAEEAQKLFLERNRLFRDSPELNFEYERLQRQVTIKQEVFITLRRSYEDARIQEVNDTPVITVIDRAVPPHRKASPKRRLNVILAFMLGGVLSIVGAFGLEFVERARAREEADFEEFSSRWSAIRSELTALVRRRRA
jgi:uncharacterized protein involved in exopolysaccharide biosynthesis